MEKSTKLVREGMDMKYNSFHPGEIWLDTSGKPIQAHGFSVFYSEQDECYYWYGENKEKTKGGLFNKIWHWGVRCYASKDLYNWEDKGLIIPPVPEDISNPLHPNHQMDRPHIIYCRNTGKYVAWLKVQNGGTDQYMTVMQADSFLGPYEFVHKQYKPLKMDTGDFDLAVDSETQKGYIIFSRPHFMVVTAELTDDYTEAAGPYAVNYEGLKPPFSREGIVCFEAGGKRYLLSSGTTSYYPNPSQIAEFTDFLSEYRDLGDPCVEDTDKSSFYGQFTDVLKVEGKNLYIAVADRWKPTKLGKWFSRKYYNMVLKAMSGGHHDNIAKPDYSPKEINPIIAKEQTHIDNTSISTYVWLPIVLENGKPQIKWYSEWKLEDFE